MKSTKGTKNISDGFLANGVIPGIHSQTSRTGPCRYTPVSVRDRRSGRDAGTQAQGGETSCYSSTCKTAKFYRLSFPRSGVGM